MNLKTSLDENCSDFVNFYIFGHEGAGETCMTSLRFPEFPIDTQPDPVNWWRG